MVQRGRKRKLGYTVFKRKDSGSYVVRFSLEGHSQFRFGLDTFDENEANVLAERIYLETKIKSEYGILTGNSSFDELAREYVDQQFVIARKDPSKLGHAKRAKATVENYLIEYFKKKPITAIYHSDIMKYLDWRKVYWTEGDGKDKDTVLHWRNGKELWMKVQHVEVSPSTLKREAGFLRAIFKHAVRQNFLKQGDVPRIELGRVPIVKRPSFTREQYHQIVLKAEKRLQDVMKKGHSDKLRFERMQICSFVIIAAETGMRPIEIFNLDWGHIEGLEEAMKASLNKREIRIFAQGKGRQPVRFVPRRESIGGFENLRSAYHYLFKRYPSKDDPVFCNHLGKRIGSLNKSLNSLLKEAGHLHDPVGNKFSAYSFRHSYATWQLQRSPPISIYSLAINMRTSVEMIEKWCSDVVPEDQAAILRGDADWE